LDEGNSSLFKSRARSSSKGRYNYKNVKMGWGHLKIFYRTTGPNLSRLDTNPPWGERIKICSN
jgi:hypothetical protein